MQCVEKAAVCQLFGGDFGRRFDGSFWSRFYWYFRCLWCRTCYGSLLRQGFGGHVGGHVSYWLFHLRNGLLRQNVYLFSVDYFVCYKEVVYRL